MSIIEKYKCDTCGDLIIDGVAIQGVIKRINNEKLDQHYTIKVDDYQHSTAFYHNCNKCFQRNIFYIEHLKETIK